MKFIYSSIFFFIFEDLSIAVDRKLLVVRTDHEKLNASKLGVPAEDVTSYDQIEYTGFNAMKDYGKLLDGNNKAAVSRRFFGSLTVEYNDSPISFTVPYSASIKCLNRLVNL